VEVTLQSAVIQLKMQPGFSTEYSGQAFGRLPCYAVAFRLSGWARGVGNALMERDSKRIVREWNREIEDEMRRLAAGQDDGKWKIVVWALLEAIWLVGLVLMLGLLTRLHW